MTQQYDEYDFMEDWDDEVDPAQQQRQQGQKSPGAGLRKQLEELLETNKQQAAFIESIRQEKAQQDVTAKLASRNLDPKLAGLMPSGLSAADQETWLDTWAPVLGTAQTHQPPAVNTPAGPALEADAIQAEIASTLTPSEQAGLQAVTNENGSGQPPAGGQDPLTTMGAIQSEEEFWRFVRSQP